MNANPAPILLAAVVALGLSACSGDSGGSDDSAAGSAAVEIADSQFRPADVEVTAGESVTWTNSEDVPHTVTFEDGSIASSDELHEGDTFTVTFDDAGTFTYMCLLHPEMTGSVTVAS